MKQTDTDPGLATTKEDYSLEAYILGINHYQIELLTKLDQAPESGCNCRRPFAQAKRRLWLSRARICDSALKRSPAGLFFVEIGSDGEPTKATQQLSETAREVCEQTAALYQTAGSFAP